MGKKHRLTAIDTVIPSTEHLQSAQEVQGCWQSSHSNEFAQQAQMASAFLQLPMSVQCCREHDRQCETKLPPP